MVGGKDINANYYMWDGAGAATGLSDCKNVKDKTI